MARVKLSALFTSISGRYGGGVFRAWKGLTVLSALPSTVDNPNTNKQSKVRSILTCGSKIWSTLAENIRNDWATVAVYLTDQWGHYENEVGSHRIIKTPRGPYTSLGALTSVCGLLGSVDEWACEDAAPTPPAGHTAPAMCTNPTVSGTTAGLVVEWDDPATWGDAETDGDVRIWVSSDDGTVFPQIAGFVAGGVETFTIVNVVHAGARDPRPLEEGFYYVQLDAVNEGGLRSAPSAVKTFIAIDPI